MKKYKVTLHYSTIIEAKDEQEAEELFMEDIVNDTQMDAETFIAENLKVSKK